MAKSNINSKQGFTIIEVVLVLAIAGLIFLMVFIALPALQRSQRDTARRNDMSRVDTSLVQYQTNNNSKSNNLPEPGAWKAPVDGSYSATPGQSCGSSDSACIFIRDYMNSGAAGDKDYNNFQDPDGVPYSLVITENWALNDITTKSINGLEGGSALTGTFTKGTGNTAGVTITTGSFSDHVVYIIPGAKCDGEYAKPAEKRHFAVLYRLEGAGVYCIDDQ